VRQTADRALAERMERLWKNEGAMRRKRLDRFEPRNRLNKPNLFATGCHWLPPKSHGKEAVPGSSPGEGLNTCKSALFRNYRAPLDQGGARRSSRREVRELPANIALRADRTEYLPGTEGLDVVAVACSTGSRWKRRHSGSRCLGPRILGTGLGDRNAQAGRNGRWLRTWFASRAS
jgi:hypothetical protein